MTPQGILSLYLVFFIIQFLWEQALTILNIQFVKNNASQPPDFIKDRIPAEEYKKSTRYTLTKQRFSIISALCGAGFVLLIVLSGFLGTLEGWIAVIKIGEYIRGIIYIFTAAFLFNIFSLPFSLYSRFSIEEKFGFNKMSYGLFFLDRIKGLVLSAIIAAPLLLLIFYLIDRTGRFWWLYGFAIVTAFQLVMTVIYPVLIAPIFNKFTPLDEGPLKEKLTGLADKLKFKIKGVFVMDGSRRTGHSNAYFTGIGRVKRIVLFDTLIASLSHDQLAAVLSHEIGHEKRRHILKNYLLSLSVTLLLFWVVGRLLTWAPLYHAFGFDNAAPHALIVLLLFCIEPFTFFLQPLFNALSRRNEYEADEYAVTALEGAKEMGEALISLNRENLSNLTPHKLYSFYHYSHPTLAERLDAMEGVHLSSEYE
jgi:STE24 endopeptidase